MFGWLFRLFGFGTDDVYRPRQRLIYRYWNGTRTIQADPMVLFKRVMEVGPSLSIDIKVSTSPSKDAQTAHAGVMDKIRGIFSVGTFDKGGLTDLETAGLLDHFLTYCDRLKKNMRPTATSAAVTSVITAPSLDDNQPTLSGSGSGSTGAEPSTVPPSPST